MASATLAASWRDQNVQATDKYGIWRLWSPSSVAESGRCGDRSHKINMLIGYARVSTNEQNLDLQRDALRKAGVTTKNLYTDKITGTKEERPGLTEALSHLREGDTLVVWRLDRLGRSLKHLIETVTTLQGQGIAFQSITENINTATATGQLVFHIFASLAEFERSVIRERTIAGVAAARLRGRIGGRPGFDPSSRKVAMAKKLYMDKTNSISEICRMLNISRATLYRWVHIGGGNLAKP